MSELRTTRPPRARESRATLTRNALSTIERTGIRQRPLSDLYHRALLMSWGRLVLLVVAAYVVLNAIFGIAYLLCGDCIVGARPGHFGDAFSFSVQTFSTIGYGAMSPRGIPANTLVTLEAVSGLVFQAVVTGLTFAKFARPTARVMFTKKLVITTHDGLPSLMVRMGNERANQVVEARLMLTVLMDHVTTEGAHMRRLTELKLQRNATPIFALSWTAIHVIDESSPLYGLGREAMEERETSFLATFVGTDDTFNQTVHARHSWNMEDVVWDHRFADIIYFRDDGTRIVDYSHFHRIEPDSAPRDA